MNKLVLIILTLSWVGSLKAQSGDTLSLDDAIQIALEYNHDIQLAEQNRIIANNNIAIGEANFLPKVDLSAGYSYSRSNTDLTFANPDQPTINQDGAVSESYNAGITMSYNIFSGGSKFHTYKRLRTQGVLSNLREQQTIETTILNVASKYLEALRLSDAFRIRKESLELSEERYRRAFEKYEYGSFGKLQLLNAEVDLRNDSIAIKTDSLSLIKAIKELNALMGIDPNESYALNSELEFINFTSVDQLYEEALQENKSLLIARSNLEISELNLKNAKSALWPRLDLSAGYQYNRQENEAGFIQSQQNLGLNAGVTLSYNLFNGLKTQRSIQNSELSVESEEINLEKIKIQLERDLMNAYDDYQTNAELLDLSARNLQLAEANFERSQEAYRTGQITGLELRDAQLNLLQSQNNVSVQRIFAKLSEIRVLYYAGKIIE